MDGATPSTRAVSWHTGAGSGRFLVEGVALNAECHVPGSPFSGGLLLAPNPPDEQPPAVTLGPVGASEIDTVSCLFESASPGPGVGSTRVRVQAIGGSGEALADSQVTLAEGGGEAVTLRLGASRQGVRLRVEVASEGNISSPAIRMRYLVAYLDNELMRLCNAVGSDKGSEVYWGEDGYPHLYALAYDALFSPWRQDRFNFLEIGLDAATYTSGQPEDAPSLRAWRNYFPHAVLYGYDLHDFAFFTQPDTRVFQGDQSSRTDIARFLAAAGSPTFRVVLDDASHASSHQQISLAALFEHVQPGGVYIIEDLDWQPFEEALTTREFLQGFIDRGTIESPFISEQEARGLEATIDRVDIYRPNDFEFAVLTKASAKRRARWRRPFVSWRKVELGR